MSPGQTRAGQAGGDAVLDHGWIASLPRILRRPLIRGWRRIEITPPMRAGRGSALALGFVGSFWLAGLLVGGHGPSVLSAVGDAAGLKTVDIVVSGHAETQENDVVAALALDGRRSLLGYDLDAARARLVALPWVRDAVLRRNWPGNLTVALVEKRPAAVWQHEERLTVIDATGGVIDRFGIDDLISNRFAGLPHLVGPQAAGQAGTILPLVAAHPPIARAAASFVHVGARRWDIILTSGVRVRLPAEGPGGALQRLAALDARYGLLARDIRTIDLRLADRTTLMLSPEAAQARAEFVAARAKAMRKADRKS